MKYIVTLMENYRQTQFKFNHIAEAGDFAIALKNSHITPPDVKKTSVIIELVNEEMEEK